MNITEKKKIAGLLTKRIVIELAFLFGSEARGTSRRESDIDVALLLSGSPSPEERLTLRTDLSDAISKITGRDVDITLLNNAGSLLKYQVACHNQNLFERRKGLAKKFRLNAIKEYFDYKPTFEFHYQRLRSRSYG